MGRCKDKIKRTCGKKINASCVDYEGTLHDNTQLEDCDCHSVEEVIEDINETLNYVTDSIDLSSLGDACLEYDKEGDKLLVREVLIKFEEVICELQNEQNELDEEGCPSIFTQDITCLGLDFMCLTDPCNNQITTLKDLLQALINEVCSNNA